MKYIVFFSHYEHSLKKVFFFKIDNVSYHECFIRLIIIDLTECPVFRCMCTHVHCRH